MRDAPRPRVESLALLALRLRSRLLAQEPVRADTHGAGTPAGSPSCRR